MLESKKYSIIEWIISLADERVIEAIESIKEKIETKSIVHSEKNQKFSFTTSSYAQIKNRKVDIAQLKADQNYQPITSVELNDIARDANIEQSIDELLFDLESLG